MLPNLRFAIGAMLASLVLIVTAFGLAATVRIAHQAKMGPFESTRTLAYADPTDWNQFYDAEGTRRFDGMGHKTDGAVIEALIERASISAPAAASTKPGTDPEPPAAPKPLLEPEPQIETGAPAATAPTATIKTTAVDTVIVESAPSRKEVESAIAEPVPEVIPAVTPPERVASLPSPADTAAVGPSDAKPEAAAPGPAVQKAAPNAKRTAKAKKKVAKRKARARTVQKSTVEIGFPVSTPRRTNDSWLFGDRN